MRILLIALMTLTAGPALAHIGHLGEVAGHGHWIALGGIAIAVGIAVLGGRKASSDTDVQSEPQSPEDTQDPDVEGEPA